MNHPQNLIKTLIQQHSIKPTYQHHSQKNPLNPDTPESSQKPVSGDLCEYSCQSNGGCSAKYTGPFREGSLFGSCFSRRFGGKCFGIPQECQSCHDYCTPEKLAQPHVVKPFSNRHPLHPKNAAFGNKPRPSLKKKPRFDKSQFPFSKTGSKVGLISFI